MLVKPPVNPRTHETTHCRSQPLRFTNPQRRGESNNMCTYLMCMCVSVCVCVSTVEAVPPVAVWKCVCVLHVIRPHPLPSSTCVWIQQHHIISQSLSQSIHINSVSRAPLHCIVYMHVRVDIDERVCVCACVCPTRWGISVGFTKGPGPALCPDTMRTMHI